MAKGTVKTIVKRDGRVAIYDEKKIASAVLKALIADGKDDPVVAARIANAVGESLAGLDSEAPPTIEKIQDAVETELMREGYEEAAKKYIIYRANRTRIRESKTSLMKAIDEITNVDARNSDMKRDNANIDGNTSMGSMLQIGTAGAKAYNAAYLLKPEQAAAHREGNIHIHDFDFYALTTTCCQIDIIRLFKGGFSTGHGFLREPQSIASYAALAAIAIQSNQNDQHGGQSIPNFDYAMALGVAKTFKKLYARKLTESYEDVTSLDEQGEFIDSVIAEIKAEKNLFPRLEIDAEALDAAVAEKLVATGKVDAQQAIHLIASARRRATRDTDRQTYQAMEGFVHNLNTMHSRAGAQTPFSSINYGTDTTPEGRMAIRNILLAEDAGLGHGETPIFPIHIFKVKEGVNYNPGDPNYDLFKLSCKVSAKRLFPNYVFLDSPFNLQYYKPGHPETEVATMGCRTRVMGNTYDPTREISYSRGNLSFTSINLPRIALETKGDEKAFYDLLDERMELVAQQLLDRFEIQASKRVYNFPFLMGQGVWLDSDTLGPNDEVREVLKHGTLSIGFIGLAETLTALYGHHHGESDEMEQKGLEIVQHMRDYCDRKSREYQMNFSLLATPAEGLSGRFIRMDRKRFGEIAGVTDKDYYTNSFHVPVWYPIPAFDKIRKEAPFHALTNAGHISYVELDGDTANNVEAFESVVRCMHDAGIGYGSINHPVDRDPVCGYVGVIGDVCPRCGRRDGEALSEEQIAELRKKYPNVPSFVGLE
ncbi:anaerobic ribonucleoside triphosphate reductase [Pygmaiobacter massiliensis]|uniref:anaerobic ribonucleoside triphosphate reductase n=1 Tax=Pygmaiobacter massiliensis TaxID=1917873 RepID=UPI000C7C06BE|nr:anaerobic ribonucleoside triphosphate reductase [Pygmaiobacter massiliensis]MDY4783726.1 anaerobic ribonucleoside triphosphate reductase [Pygmaiobacter massiliensis]